MAAIGALGQVLAHRRNACPSAESEESEADHIGLLYMARAGYDPHEAHRLLEAHEHAQTSHGAPPEFLSDHPS